jgi:hypothetical protein
MGAFDDLIPQASADPGDVRQKLKTANMANQLAERAVGPMEAFTQWKQPTVGAFSNLFRMIPGTAAHNLEKDLDTVRANVGFDRLQQMREGSKTGGALGNVSEKENLLLQATAGAVDPSQSADQFRRNLMGISDEYRTRLGEKGVATRKVPVAGMIGGGRAAQPKSRLRYNPATGDIE